jgi:hypothetical protein
VTSWGVGVRSTSPEALTAERQLRLTVTSRPASGGSPTRRYGSVRRVVMIWVCMEM